MYKQLNNILLSYLAGFIDGDGCINVQVVRRQDYVLGYQLRFIVSFTQSTIRRSHLDWLKQTLDGVGSIRDRGDGVSEYAIVGIDNVRPLLLLLVPYLRAKRNQAELCLRIMNQYSSTMSVTKFLRLVKLADQFIYLNDSKKRTVTYAVVRKHLLSDVMGPRRVRLRGRTYRQC